MDTHGTPHGALGIDVLTVAPFLVAVLMYAAGVALEIRRRRRWPWYRGLFWCLGVTAAASGFVGPLASAAHDGFLAHTAAHLLVGMVAPLFLVLAAPGTLALRTLSVVPARRLSRLLRSRVVRFCTHPVVAAALNVGGLFAVYLTPLYGAMQRDQLLHLVVMAHFLVSGYLYTLALVPVDPAPHRASFAMRGTVLVLSLAAHGILAKLLYAYPVTGVARADAQAGSELMFYGGDLVEFVLIVLLWSQWYGASRRTAPDAVVGRIRVPASAR